jgi:entericidin B
MTQPLIMLFLLSTVTLAACHTVAGAGEDISKGGHAITNSAERHSD